MYCRHCHYDLRGQENPRCPECGRAFDIDDPQSYYEPRHRNMIQVVHGVCDWGRDHWRMLYFAIIAYSLVLALLAPSCVRIGAWYHDGIRYRDSVFARLNLQSLLNGWSIVRDETGAMQFDRTAVGDFCGTSSTLHEFRIKYSISKCARGLQWITVPLASFFGLASVLFWKFNRRRWIYCGAMALAVLTQITLVVLDRQADRIWPPSYKYIDDYVFLDNLKPADQYRPSAIVAYQPEPLFQDVYLVGTMDGRVTYVRANAPDRMADALRAILERGTESEPRPSGGGAANHGRGSSQ